MSETMPVFEIMPSPPPSLLDLFRGLRPQSNESLEEAVRLRRRPGMTGTMVVHIPADVDQACEVVVVTGTARVVVDPAKI